MPPNRIGKKDIYLLGINLLERKNNKRREIKENNELIM
jgi:hypothetical protein